MDYRYEATWVKARLRVRHFKERYGVYSRRNPFFLPTPQVPTGSWPRYVPLTCVAYMLPRFDFLSKWLGTTSSWPLFVPRHIPHTSEQLRERTHLFLYYITRLGSHSATLYPWFSPVVLFLIQSWHLNSAVFAQDS
jgi:hypothetical protein